ncbi:sucrose-phosphatase 2-like [Iris pallida]|uniref:Sucrose-phosphatase 2-like n=1 Tax=Iris pallida TaxID=29817 RepID=A0AAX6FCS3_IRIPA|nr:sucrose-phosphatase 2-like [Iris pallida]
MLVGSTTRSSCSSSCSDLCIKAQLLFIPLDWSVPFMDVQMHLDNAMETNKEKTFEFGWIEYLLLRLDQMTG